MGGSADDKPKNRRPAPKPPRSPDDPCDLEFGVDLVHMIAGPVGGPSSDMQRYEG